MALASAALPFSVVVACASSLEEVSFASTGMLSMVVARARSLEEVSFASTGMPF